MAKEPETELAKVLQQIIKNTDQLVRDIRKDGRALTKALMKLEELRQKAKDKDEKD